MIKLFIGIHTAEKILDNSTDNDIKEYFEFYKEEVPEVFGGEDVGAISFVDMVNSLRFKSMASHKCKKEQIYVVDFRLGYDQILCAKFDCDFKYIGIDWES